MTTAFPINGAPELLPVLAFLETLRQPGTFRLIRRTDTAAGPANLLPAFATAALLRLMSAPVARERQDLIQVNRPCRLLG